MVQGNGFTERGHWFPAAIRVITLPGRGATGQGMWLRWKGAVEGPWRRHMVLVGSALWTDSGRWQHAERKQEQPWHVDTSTNHDMSGSFWAAECHLAQPNVECQRQDHKIFWKCLLGGCTLQHSHSNWSTSWQWPQKQRLAVARQVELFILRLSSSPQKHVGPSAISAAKTYLTNCETHTHTHTKSFQSYADYTGYSLGWQVAKQGIKIINPSHLTGNAPNAASSILSAGWMAFDLKEHMSQCPIDAPGKKHLSGVHNCTYNTKKKKTKSQQLNHTERTSVKTGKRRWRKNGGRRADSHACLRMDRQVSIVDLESFTTNKTTA